MAPTEWPETHGARSILASQAGRHDFSPDPPRTHLKKQVHAEGRYGSCSSRKRLTVCLHFERSIAQLKIVKLF